MHSPSGMRQTTILDRITAITIVVCVIAVPAWVTFQFSDAKEDQQDNFEQYLDGTGVWANSMLRGMTLEQKVSQLFVPFAFGVYRSADDPRYQRLVDLVENFQVGGVLFMQGDPFSQALLANDLQGRSQIPLVTSQDMELGAGMRLSSTTKFPSAMAIGATRNTDMAYAAGLVTAREARALGIFQVFAPVADINNNARNPVINVRSFGEQPQLVADMVTAFTFGLQDGKVIATAKHFPGHGDTATDSHNHLPILPFDRARLDSVELVPFRAVRDAGIMSMMMGHLALPELEPDVSVPATLAPAVVTSLLREDMGFKGLIVSDAMRMLGVTKSFGPGESAVRAIEAGVDVLVLSDDEYAARAAILRAIEEGRLTEERIDESVLRILTTKEWLGVHNNRFTDPADTRLIVASAHHRMLSETIARASLTLVRNQNNLLPLHPAPRRILSITLSETDDPLLGDYFADQIKEIGSPAILKSQLLDLRSQRDDFAAALNEANLADVIIVPTFLPVRSGTNRLALPTHLQGFLNSLLAKNKPIILISFGSPYLVEALASQPSVYLAAYGDSEASQKAAVQAMFGQSTINGKLPITIPGLYPLGHGIDVQQKIVRAGFPEEVGMNGVILSRIDSLMRAAIADRAFPGAAVAIGRPNVQVKLEGYGYFTYDSEQRITPQSIFDLASLTKVISTTTAVMQLYEAGRISLDDRVADYLPRFGQHGKGDITVRNLMTHTSGLIPFRPFHTQGVTSRQGIIDAIFAEELVYEPGAEMKYSDFNMILMALIIEKITGQSFASYASEHIFRPLGMTRTGFRRAGAGSDRTIVPTEIDQIFRKKLIQGEVHDETAFILGGTAGHAGLFSTAEDLSRFAFMLVNKGMHEGVQFLKPETIELFTTPVDPTRHTRALGWDTKSPQGYSSAGQRFSLRSFGHTGFTGTSIWIDPEAELFVILLTNRVYPTRENKKHSAVRAALADIAHASLVGKPEPVLPSSQH